MGVSVAVNLESLKPRRKSKERLAAAPSDPRISGGETPGRYRLQTPIPLRVI